MAEQPVTPTFCLTIPSGRWNLAPLVTGIREHHPESPIVAVWCGDPHLRPVLDRKLDVAWADSALPTFGDIAWPLLLIALSPRIYEWCRTAATVLRLLADGAAAVVMLRVGSAAVFGRCDGLVPPGSSVVLVSRLNASLPADGLTPTEDDAQKLGLHSTVVAGFGPAASPALTWLLDNLVGSTGGIGGWMDRLAMVHGAASISDDSVCVAGWRAAGKGDVSVLDLDHVDLDEPWHFTFGRPARLRLSADARMAELVARGIQQCGGSGAAMSLPGGIAVDGAMRHVVNGALADFRSTTDALPPEPFGEDNHAFMAWLEAAQPWSAGVSRYGLALRNGRADLQTIFPEPHSHDAARFREWLDTSWRLEAGRSVLLRSGEHLAVPIVPMANDPEGINVLGYFDFDQSQGHIARRLADALTIAGVGVSRLNHHRSHGSRRPTPIEEPREARYATNLVVVNADQFEFVVADHGATLLDGRRTIAYWFWELEDVPKRFLDAIDHVDEIWTGSQFIAAAFSRVTDKPVQCVPLPVAQPRPSDRGRASMGLPEDAYVFLTTFDQFSVPERKNPFGTIEAFARAFADGEGPVLLIKTMNGAKGWRNHERLLLAASGRSDIIVWDEHLSRADQMAVLAASDCLVSLHRSEGLGLHCAEAMWLGKPVIATAYSGNLDFMDDSVAAMIGFEMVHVRHGEGIYPSTAMWADPDLDQAAAWMRRLVADPAVGRDLGARARQRMQQQPSLAETGRLMARLAGLQPTNTDTTADQTGIDISTNRSGGTSSWD